MSKYPKYPKITEFSKILPSEVSVQNPSPKKAKVIPITLGILKSDLTPNQKIITGLLSFKCGPRLHCELSYEKLSQEVGITLRSIIRNIKILEEKEIINLKIIKNKKRCLFLYEPTLYEDYFLNPEEKKKYKKGDIIPLYKKFKRIYIPYNWVKSKEINPEEKLCLGALYTYSYDGTNCIVEGGQKELARTLNLTERGVKHLIKRIKDKGFITTDREGNIATYTFLSKFTSLIKGENMTNSEQDTRKQFIDFYKERFYVEGSGITFHRSFLNRDLSLPEALILGALMKKEVEIDKKNKGETDYSFSYLQTDISKDCSIDLRIVNTSIKKLKRKGYIQITKKTNQNYYNFNINKIYPIILED